MKAEGKLCMNYQSDHELVNLFIVVGYLKVVTRTDGELELQEFRPSFIQVESKVAKACSLQ